VLLSVCIETAPHQSKKCSPVRLDDFEAPIALVRHELQTHSDEVEDIDDLVLPANIRSAPQCFGGGDC